MGPRHYKGSLIIKIVLIKALANPLKKKQFLLDYDYLFRLGFESQVWQQILRQLVTSFILPRFADLFFHWLWLIHHLGNLLRTCLVLYGLPQIQLQQTHAKTTTGWWFGSFFIFHDSWDDDPIWLIFFRGVGIPPKKTRLPVGLVAPIGNWVCLKIVYPFLPNGFADHYPY